MAKATAGFLLCLLSTIATIGIFFLVLRKREDCLRSGIAQITYKVI